MTRFHTVMVASGLVLALCDGVAQAQPNKPMLTLQMPAMPEPVRVTLNPATTALLALDYVERICNSQPKCKSQMLPAMTPFMAQVRKAGLVVAYGTLEDNVTKWLPEVAPKPGDIQITSRVSGEVRVQGSTKNVNISWDELIAFTSRLMTLRPGDIITTGMPHGLGEEIMLKPGDMVEGEIERLGVLRNPTVAEA